MLVFALHADVAEQHGGEVGPIMGDSIYRCSSSTGPNYFEVPYSVPSTKPNPLFPWVSRPKCVHVFLRGPSVADIDADLKHPINTHFP